MKNNVSDAIHQKFPVIQMDKPNIFHAIFHFTLINNS